MSTARGYRMAADHARNPVLLERALRVCLALVLFAGFFAIGRTTAPVGAGEATSANALSSARSVAVVPLGLPGASPLDGALSERAALERAALARAQAAAAARVRHAHRTRAAGLGPAVASRTLAPAAQQPLVPTPSAQPTPSPVTTPSTQPPTAPRNSSTSRPSGSSGGGTSFDSSG